MNVTSDLKIHRDERGEIREVSVPDVLPEKGIQSVLYITGKEGAIRAGHYHHKDTHWCYVLNGTIRYWWKDAGGSETYSRILVPGDVVFTPAGEWHKFEFITSGVFIAMATEPRTQNSYEADTVRVTF